MNEEIDPSIKQSQISKNKPADGYVPGRRNFLRSALLAGAAALTLSAIPKKAEGDQPKEEINNQELSEKLRQNYPPKIEKGRIRAGHYRTPEGTPVPRKEINIGDFPFMQIEGAVWEDDRTAIEKPFGYNLVRLKLGPNGWEPNPQDSWVAGWVYDYDRDKDELLVLDWGEEEKDYVAHDEAIFLHNYKLIVDGRVTNLFDEKTGRGAKLKFFKKTMTPPLVDGYLGPPIGDPSGEYISAQIVGKEVVQLADENDILTRSGTTRDSKGRLLYAMISCYPITATGITTQRLVHWFYLDQETPSKQTPS